MLKIETRGGPSNPQSGWEKVQRLVMEQVKRLAEHLKLQGDLQLSAVEPRVGSAAVQGLRAQRHDPDPNRPAVLLLAQPGDNKTCWLWRLQFPRGTDAQMMYGRFQIAIEEGWHLKGAEGSADKTNVVPIRQPQLVVEQSTTAGPSSGDILSDESWMLNLLACVFGNIPTRGRGRTILMACALDEVVRQIGPHYPRREAGRIVEGFEGRRWIKKNKDDRSVTFVEGGLVALHGGGIDVSDVIDAEKLAALLSQPPAAPTVAEGEDVADVQPVEAVKPAPAEQVPAPQHLVAFKDHIADLAGRAKRYAQAVAALGSIDEKLSRLHARREELAREVATVGSDIERFEQSRATEQAIAEDPAHADAAAELAGYQRAMKEAGL